MSQSVNRTLRMGTESVPKLLLEFSVPVMTGMIVQAIYNLVNRIFIGNSPEAATAGLAAITVGMPISLVGMSLGALVGFGGPAALSLFLGEKKHDLAEKVLGNGFAVSTFLGLLMTVIGLIFLDPILVLLGATPAIMPYARIYNIIIILGSVPLTIGFAMNNFVRAEGNPARAMISMISSALANVIFDFLFIIVFHMGVAGAAIGTVLAQLVTATIVIQYYASPKCQVKFHWKNLKPDSAIIKKILALGSAAFFMNIGACVVQIVLNNQLTHFGGEVGLAAWGIIQTVALFFLFPIFGLNGGSQPLVGYNYGAKNFLRVRTTAKWAILAATTFTCLAFGVIELFASPIISVFTGKDIALHQIATSGIRLMFLFFPIVGFQIIGSGYFTAIGRPIKSMFLSLSRQVLFLLPLAWTLPHFLGLYGIFWAAPISDFLAALVTLILFLREFNHLQDKHDQNKVIVKQPEVV